MLKVGTLVQIIIEVLITVIMGIAGYNLHDMASDVKMLNASMATIVEKVTNHDREIVAVRFEYADLERRLRDQEQFTAVLRKQLDDLSHRR